MLVSLLIFCVLFCNCSYFNRNDSKGNAVISDSLLLANLRNLNTQLWKDSIYADLILKINKENAYIPIIGYIVTNIIPECYMEDYCRVGDESFFNDPLHHLSKISIKDQTLVIAEFNVIRQRYYFLLNEASQITDHLEFTSYRECIDRRKISDWDRDGSLDIVEQRTYNGQLFSSTTDVVYSTINGVFERIFSLETQELNLVTLDKHGRGSLVRRTYKREQPSVFRITEMRGLVDGYIDTSGDQLLSPDNGYSKHYEMTTHELLAKFGTQYDRIE